MQKLFGTPERDKIDDFMRKPGYIMLVMLLCAVSFALGGELVLYTLFALLAVYITVFSRDLLPITPLVICAYVVPSVANNPGRSEESVFHGGKGIYVLCLGALIAALFLYRVIRDRKGFFGEKRALLSGFLVLGAAYLLSGIGSAGYGALAGKNLLFALLQALALLLPYWLLTGGVNWKNLRKDYFAWVGFGLGCLLLFQVLWIYISGDVINDAGVIDRRLIYTGWGMYNNLGSLLAMMIPFAFYLAFVYQKGWMGILAGLALLVGVILSCSRSSMIIGLMCYIACCCLMVLYGKKRRRNAVIVVSIAVLVVVIAALFHRQIIQLFSQILDDAHEMESRIDIYQNGWKEFLKNPLFGTTFYPAEGLSWSWSTTNVTSFIPARWHNTVIQLLASTGIVGIGAYLLHRYQTIRLALRLKSRKQALLVISALVLLLCSMVDCHLFNIGPALFYSMLLAYLEKQTA